MVFEDAGINHADQADRFLGELTYRELDEQAGSLAAWLRARGVGPDALVAVEIERSPEMIVALLGVLKAGGAYVPVDPNYPEERRRFILEDAGIKLVVTRETVLEAISAALAPAPRPVQSPDSLAYVIYTSGSTGRPKGVMLSHRGLLNLVHEQTRGFGVTPESRVLQFASFSFDASVSEIFMALTTGARLYLASQDTLMSPPELERLMRREAITTITLPPSLLSVLDPGRVPELKSLISAGEACSWEIVSRWAPGRRFLNAYGPTECTIGPTFYVADAAVRPSRNVPIGRPIGNTRVYILDGNLEPVPVGIPGELYVAGVGLARGYVNRPDLTAERFLPDPFSAQGGGRMYRTGDLARYLADGNIEYLGRADDQVKVRGFRVELGEVASALREHPGVEDAVVVVRENRLVAYVTAGSAEGLREFVRQRLPEYMVPAAVVALTAFPLTPNGKVDRKALPAPEFTERQVEYAAPRGAEEEILAGIWSELLKLERVGRHDDFFDLGGHSLLATQAMSRVRSVFEVDLPLRALFEAPTVAGLAVAVGAARHAAVGPMEPAVRGGELPLSFAQQRLWFLEQLEPGTPLYNLPIAVKLVGQLDVEALEWALNQVIRRHEILRTSFISVEGRAAQVVAPEMTIRFTVVEAAEADVPELASEEAQRPFDITTAPLLRARLLRLGPEHHVALLTMHHIVSDGWSMSVLVGEIAALYEARVTGGTAALPGLPIQYADFAVWQRGWLRGETLDQELAYWKNQLTGLPPLLELPADRPRPKYQTFRGGTIAFAIPPGTARALEAFGRAEGATLFMTLVAAFEALLHRYTGQEEFAVGTPSANRNRPEIEGLIGFFVNTLVLRADLTGDPSFRELLGRVRRTALEAYAHQDAPFEMVVDAVAPERDMSHTPLFQAMFVFQNTPPLGRRLPGLEISAVEAETGIAKFDLTFSMAGSADGLSGSIEYNSDLFDVSTIERMAGHFRNLLDSLAGAPDEAVSKLGWLAPDELRGRSASAGTVSSFACGDSIHQRFEAQVARTPEAVAVSFEGTALSYAELNARANRLARHLRGLGTRPDSVVALLMERSSELVVAILGVLKSGAAYLPIDPVYPADRMAFMLEDAGAAILITDDVMRSRVPETAATVLSMSSVGAGIEDDGDGNPRPVSGPGNVAYVIYTSGSTGKPKGVMVTHANVVRLMDATYDWYRFDSADVWTLFHSYAFDFSVWELWGALLYGGRLVVVPYLVSRSPEAFYRLLGDEGVTVLNQTPSAFRQLIQAEETVGAQPGLALRYVVFGGEALELESLRPWFERHGDRRPRLINMYGITETTVHVTYRPIDLADVEQGRGSVIGRPIPDLELYVLDRHLMPMPIGVPGELFVGGAGCARGYLNRPELTADRFLPNPFSAAPGSRLYRTGDLARYLADGDIEYLGRIDHQVKIRGFRIELGEIESVLAQHPGIREAACLVREDEPGSKRVVAYLVAKDGAEPTALELRAFVQQKLPEYMTPSAFVQLPALPLTSNGKLDRRALPAPEKLRIELGEVYRAPESREEEILCEVWARLLGVARVGTEDNFFALGGDSILAIQAIAQASQAGLELTPRQLFEHPTVRGLAQAAGKAGRVVESAQGPVSGRVPLTPVAHWFFEHHADAPHHFNSSMFLEVERWLVPERLEEALQALVRHHDALRLRFEKSGSEWTAWNAEPEEGPVLEVCDLSELPRRKRGRAIEEKCAGLQAGFDLARGPLVRAVWFDRGAEESGRLLLLFHHLVTDGVSWRIFLEDLQTAYMQLSRGESVALPRKTASYQRWTEGLAEYAASGELSREREYWESLPLDGVAQIPLDYPGGANTYGSTADITESLDAAMTKALLPDAQVILLEALARTIGGWSKADRVLIETEGHGREELLAGVDVSRTMGWFTSIYPMVLSAGGEDCAEQLRNLPNRGAGYGILKYLRGEFPDHPAPEINFNYLGQFDRMPGGMALPFRIAAGSSGPEQAPNGRRSAALYVVAIVTGDQLHVRWLYSRNLHKRRTIQRLAERYMEELRDIMRGRMRGKWTH